MYYVYILYSNRDKKLYTGCTNNLKKRFQEHNEQKVDSTKNRTPLKLVFYEAFTNKTDAFAREQWLKTGFGRIHMRKMLNKTLKVLEGK